nr:hypothetical protein HmN_000460700 [Hymenolepis microstoma]
MLIIAPYLPPELPAINGTAKENFEQLKINALPTGDILGLLKFVCAAVGNPGIRVSGLSTDGGAVAWFLAHRQCGSTGLLLCACSCFRYPDPYPYECKDTANTKSMRSFLTTLRKKEETAR